MVNHVIFRSRCRPGDPQGPHGARQRGAHRTASCAAHQRCHLHRRGLRSLACSRGVDSPGATLHQGAEAAGDRVLPGFGGQIWGYD